MKRRDKRQLFRETIICALFGDRANSLCWRWHVDFTAFSSNKLLFFSLTLLYWYDLTCLLSTKNENFLERRTRSLLIDTYINELIIGPVFICARHWPLLDRVVEIRRKLSLCFYCLKKEQWSALMRTCNRIIVFNNLHKIEIK